MREARYGSLIPRTTLLSDSEHLLPRQQHDTIILLYRANRFTRETYYTAGLLVIVCFIHCMDRHHIYMMCDWGGGGGLLVEWRG
jgi:hypothetical protein